MYSQPLGPDCRMISPSLFLQASTPCHHNGFVDSAFLVSETEDTSSVLRICGIEIDEVACLETSGYDFDVAN